ncbi:uncharacterized protein AlacWU_02321 [Aspergillus niger]|uniref:Uncharacterized protein n=3 Tax=Aspergillus niger TaxID=5061 RepID=A5ABW4_ASPNC|nr:uncharacterized protein BO96DRAFT_435348 [Aspergillus niger CBS 101883]XP_059606476.1 hypothetical protein An15g03660 [Aspergillus niger]RDH14969.1 hypothetical protein M747DRAFT_248247 [Aspergillus niger ATCC 13496]PYH55494.1 hypothetical protein BO96DRAFT_435348 [Aspergillus niger CBS 101883]CAK97236.1 hypothetical protein An15g03660 [Aspergillus niger]GJP89422.1 uncharacterized protein AlacWU_02321 [Aspergillus niger]
MAEGRAQDGKDRRRKLRSEMINIRASPSRVQECLVGWTLTKQGANPETERMKTQVRSREPREDEKKRGGHKATYKRSLKRRELEIQRDAKMTDGGEGEEREKKKGRGGEKARGKGKQRRRDTGLGSEAGAPEKGGHLVPTGHSAPGFPFLSPLFFQQRLWRWRDKHKWSISRSSPNDTLLATGGKIEARDAQSLPYDEYKSNFCQHHRTRDSLYQFHSPLFHPGQSEDSRPANSVLLKALTPQGPALMSSHENKASTTSNEFAKHQKGATEKGRGKEASAVSHNRINNRKIPGHIQALPQWLQQSIEMFHEKPRDEVRRGILQSRTLQIETHGQRETTFGLTALNFKCVGTIRDTEPRHACIIHHQGMPEARRKRTDRIKAVDSGTGEERTQYTKVANDIELPVDRDFDDKTYKKAAASCENHDLWK